MIELAQFHFLRPLWLLAALPACALAVALWRAPGSGANWRRAIAPELLDYLLEGRTEQRRRWPWLALAGWLLATLAMAGPTWEKLPQPVLQKRDALVIVLDLSLSMYAEDVQPSRLQRARFKILDVLRRRQEGLTGLVVYSGDAHVVSPLTDDTATIANLVPALAPEMMPIYGSDPTAGIEQALQLLRNAGFERGRILLLSDDISDANIEAIAQRIDPAKWQLSILGVGTAQGAPIPITPPPATGKNRDRPAAAGGFLKQADGQIVVAQLHGERFEQLAGRTQGRYRELRADDRDLDALLPDALPLESETRAIQREFDRWRERGPWLASALLPLAALVFRRGWLLVLLLLPLSLPGPALAADTAPVVAPRSLWRDLWQRPDQRAQRTLQSGDAKSAAEQFRDPAWRGAAQYRAGDFEAAAQTLQGLDNFDADYNRGNALARAGHLQEAIAAYDAALQKSPDAEDARANRELVEKLLKQQQQQQSNQQNQQNQQQQDQSSQDSSGQQSQDNQSQSGNKQSQDGQSQGQQSQDDQSPGKQSQDNQSQGGQSQDQQNEPASAQNKSGQEQDGSAAAQSPDNAAEQQDAANKSQPGQANPRQEKNDAQQGDSAMASEADQQKSDQRAGAAPDDQARQQQQHATEQWLRQIPDDPSGLLRRKFLYEHRQRERSDQPRDAQQPLW